MKLADEAPEEKVLTSLQQSARGMLLWARFMIEDLSESDRSIEEIKAALQDLPRGLDELYGRVLDNLHSNSTRRERSRQLFQWLVCGVRPLTIAELNEALEIGLDDEHFQPKKKFPNFAATLRQCCVPLIDIDASHDASHETTRVTLIHASVKDFLLSTPGGNPTFSSLFAESIIAHEYIARACLTDLSFNEISLLDVNNVEDLSLASLQKLEAYLGTYGFLMYASFKWFMHLQECRTSREAIQSFNRFYSSQDSIIKWLALIRLLMWGNHLGLFKIPKNISLFGFTGPLDEFAKKLEQHTNSNITPWPALDPETCLSPMTSKLSGMSYGPSPQE